MTGMVSHMPQRSRHTSPGPHLQQRGGGLGKLRLRGGRCHVLLRGRL